MAVGKAAGDGAEAASRREKLKQKALALVQFFLSHDICREADQGQRFVQFLSVIRIRIGLISCILLARFRMPCRMSDDDEIVEVKYTINIEEIQTACFGDRLGDPDQGSHRRLIMISGLQI